MGCMRIVIGGQAQSDAGLILARSRLMQNASGQVGAALLRQILYPLACTPRQPIVWPLQARPPTSDPPK